MSGVGVVPVALRVCKTEGAEFPATLIQLQRQGHDNSVCPGRETIRRAQANQYVATRAEPSRFVATCAARLTRDKRRHTGYSEAEQTSVHELILPQRSGGRAATMPDLEVGGIGSAFGAARPGGSCSARGNAIAPGHRRLRRHCRGGCVMNPTRMTPAIS